VGRPITLFTGQWADLPFEEVARLASGWGYDGLEIACWGDHLDPWRWDDDAYVQSRLDVLDRYGLKVWAISNHLKGQAVCDDPIDQRHRDMLPDVVWGDGDPEGVRRRAAQEMQHTARLAARLGVRTVVGFTGSAIWKYVAMFPPVSAAAIEAGYQDFADRWNPILDVFDEVGVRFAHEVHPSEIAYDYWSTVRTLEAIGHREAFGLNWDPSHMVWQDLDPVGFLWDFRDRIYHVDCKDTKKRMTNGRNGRLGSHLPWADPRRGWDFVSTGHGDVPWEDAFRALSAIGYDGPLSVEWEDAGMDRLVGAPEALASGGSPSSRRTPPSTRPSRRAEALGARDQRHVPAPAQRRLDRRLRLFGRDPQRLRDLGGHHGQRLPQQLTLGGGPGLGTARRDLPDHQAGLLQVAAGQPLLVVLHPARPLLGHRGLRRLHQRQQLGDPAGGADLAQPDVGGTVGRHADRQRVGRRPGDELQVGARSPADHPLDHPVDADRAVVGVDDRLAFAERHSSPRARCECPARHPARRAGRPRR
jgi:sugar phosphate isomerase/epimerase